jgi:hypothetical protein
MIFDHSFVWYANKKYNNTLLLSDQKDVAWQTFLFRDNQKIILGQNHNYVFIWAFMKIKKKKKKERFKYKNIHICMYFSFLENSNNFLF